MKLSSIARQLHEKAVFFRDRELAFMAQEVARYATSDVGELPPPQLLSVNKVAAMLSLSEDYVRKQIRAGKIRSRKIGTRRVVRLQDVHEYLNGVS